MLSDRQQVLSHLYIALQKSSDQSIIKKEIGLEGIEGYLYFRNNKEGQTYSIMLTDVLLNVANVTEQEAWKRAEENTFSETTLVSMKEIIARMLDVPYDETQDETQDGELPFYVLSNASNFRGASSILNKEVLKEFGKKFNTDKIVCMPSSIHETLITPYRANTDIDALSQMVCDVNNEQVDEVERLTDRAYIITL